MDNDNGLINLLKEIADNKETDLRIYKIKFEKINNSIDFKGYTEVDKLLDKSLKEEKRKSLLQNMKKIQNEFLNADYNKERFINLLNHIELRDYILDSKEQMDKECNELRKEFNEAREEMNKTKKQMNKTKKHMDNSETSLITVLGIFSGIVITFTGGLSFVSNLMQGIASISKYRLIFVIVLLSFIMFNIIFMLMYTIGKISDKYVGSNNNCSCKNDICDKRGITCILLRYPFVIGFNLLMIYILLIVTIIYLLNQYNMSGLWVIITIGLSVLIGVICSIIGLSIVKCNKTKK